MLSERSQVVFRVAIDATKPEIKAAVEGLFGVRCGGQHAGGKSKGRAVGAEGQDEALPGPAGPASDVKKAFVGWPKARAST